MRTIAMEGAARSEVRVLTTGRGRSRLALLGAAVALWLAACWAAGAWVRLEAFQTCYDISAQRLERARLIDDNRRLGLDLARLGALDRLEAVASGQLGMKFPSQNEVVVLP
jgi:cell division protein FtsL